MNDQPNDHRFRNEHTRIEELAAASHTRLSRRSVLKGFGALAAGTALAVCSSSGSSKASPTRTPTTLLQPTSTTSPRVLKPGSLPNPSLPEGTDTIPEIEHIVVLMMENHSYDDHFGMLKRGDGFTLGSDGLPLDANPYNGKLLKSFHMPSTCQLVAHPAQDWNDSHASFNNGRNDGFTTGGSGPVAMGYWDETDIPFYYGLANTFPLADRFFCSVLAQTYPNRRFLIAGTAAGIISTSSADLVAPPPPNGTIFDRLDKHGISWLNYYTDLPSTAIIPPVVTENPTKITKSTQFLTDAAAGKLPSFCIVDPNFGEQSGENPQDLRLSERFAADIINAAMHGPAWDKTLIIWTYDEHGGYYDHVPPPRAIRPDNIPPNIKVPPDLPGGYDRYGFRIPTVMISPYARPNYVSHVTHDLTSILKLVETKWNLPAMTYRDANADNLLDSLDLKGKPAFLDPPTLPAPALTKPALPFSDANVVAAAKQDSCVTGEPGGPIPPPDAVVPLSEAGNLRVGAT